MRPLRILAEDRVAVGHIAVQVDMHASLLPLQDVWRKQSDEGISLITFGGFSTLQIVGILHGIFQHDLAMILGMGASFLTCGTVTGLTLYYRILRLRRSR